MPLAPVKHNGDTSLVQQTMDAVTDYIRDEGLRVGDTMPGEAHFARSLGVSRAVMREAFGALAALRVIDVGNGRKPRVGAIDGSVMASSLNHAVDTAQITVAQVWDVRRTIETRTAALAAELRTPEEAAAIIALAQAMAASVNDQAALTRHDIAFHHAIAKASHNNLFVQIVSSFSHLMQVAVPTAWSTRVAATQRDAMIARHWALAKAIENSDPAAAARAMSVHFDDSIGDLLEGMAAAKGANDH